LDTSTTQVRLDLEFAFANPLYATLSAAAAPKVADLMVKAFEERVDALLKDRPELIKNKLG
jgi:coenzyme Q-binding protein COQ10